MSKRSIAFLLACACTVQAGAGTTKDYIWMDNDATAWMCPSGYSKMTASECEAACPTMGFKWQYAQSWGDHQTGCFTQCSTINGCSTAHSCWYNTNDNPASIQQVRYMVCIKSENTVSTTLTVGSTEIADAVAVAACAAVAPKQCSTTIDGVTITVNVVSRDDADTSEAVLALIEADASVQDASVFTVSTTLTASSNAVANAVALAACEAVAPKQCTSTIDGVAITVNVETSDAADTSEAIRAHIEADTGVQTANAWSVSTTITANGSQYANGMAQAACTALAPRECTTAIDADGVTITVTVKTNSEGDTANSIRTVVLADAAVQAANGPSMQSQIDALLDKINSLELALAGCAKTQDLTIYAKTEDIAEQCVE